MPIDVWCPRGLEPVHATTRVGASVPILGATHKHTGGSAT
jgi:hypothetical protein